MDIEQTDFICSITEGNYQKKLMDRRVEKTRNAIFDALISLMSEKDFEKITINEIAEKANVNRGTVYFHYQDKYELLDKCIENYLNNFIKECSSKSPETLMLESFKFLEENASIFYTLLNNRGTAVFRQTLQNTILISLNKNINGSTRNINFEIRNQFLSSAVIGVIEWWIKESIPYTPEEMVENILLLFDKI